MKRPLFSIVIPTRGRPALLRYALESALNQRFDDYEIVVSDNSDSDETFKLVNNFADNRIRYVKTDRILSMPDSWEFALTKATGEYVTFLGDDDVHSSYLLRCIERVLRDGSYDVISWNRAHYFFGDYPDACKAYHLRIHPFSGTIRIVSTIMDLCRKLFQLQLPLEIPLFLNSFCSKRLIDTARNKLGRIFYPPAPDYSSCLVVLGLSETLLYLDIPLRIGGHSALSTARSVSSTRAFVRDFGGSPLFEYVPLKKAVTPINTVAESLMRVKQAFPERFGAFDLNWHRYFFLNYFELRTRVQKGLVDRESMDEFFETLRDQFPWPTRTRIRLSIYYRSFRQVMRRLISRSPLLSALEGWVRGRPPSETWVRCPSIIDAVRYLDTQILPTYVGALGLSE